jgi:hypothetical protein
MIFGRTLFRCAKLALAERLNERADTLLAVLPYGRCRQSETFDEGDLYQDHGRSQRPLVPIARGFMRGAFIAFHNGVHYALCP